MDRYKDTLGQMEKTMDDSHAEHLQATSCPSYHSSNYPSCHCSNYPSCHSSNYPSCHCSNCLSCHCSNYPSCHCSNCPNISLFKLPLMYISSFLGEKMKSWKVK